MRADFLASNPFLGTLTADRRICLSEVPVDAQQHPGDVLPCDDYS